MGSWRDMSQSDRDRLNRWYDLPGVPASVAAGDMRFQGIYTVPVERAAPEAEEDAPGTARDEEHTTLDPSFNRTTEVRVVDPATGGAKGSKLARFDLLPAEALTLVAEHFGRGAEKYEDRNWERGYKWSLSFAAMQRHAWAFWGGESLDPETQSHHLAAVVFHALALMTYESRDAGTDDRSN